MDTEKIRWTLEERLNQYGWELSRELFGGVGWDINDFEPYNYNYLLDNSKSLQDLVKGLRELSPLADDALEVAEGMTDSDFYEFKFVLANERRLASGEILEEESKMPCRYQSLIIPKRFLYATDLAEISHASLGTVLIRIMEMEGDNP